MSQRQQLLEDPKLPGLYIYETKSTKCNDKEIGVRLQIEDTGPFPFDFEGIIHWMESSLSPHVAERIVDFAIRLEYLFKIYDSAEDEMVFKVDGNTGTAEDEEAKRLQTLEVLVATIRRKMTNIQSLLVTYESRDRVIDDDEKLSQLKYAITVVLPLSAYPNLNRLEILDGGEYCLASPMIHISDNPWMKFPDFWNDDPFLEMNVAYIADGDDAKEKKKKVPPRAFSVPVAFCCSDLVIDYCYLSNIIDALNNRRNSSNFCTILKLSPSLVANGTANGTANASDNVDDSLLFVKSFFGGSLDPIERIRIMMEDSAVVLRTRYDLAFEYFEYHLVSNTHLDYVFHLLRRCQVENLHTVEIVTTPKGVDVNSRVIDYISTSIDDCKISTLNICFMMAIESSLQERKDTIIALFHALSCCNRGVLRTLNLVTRLYEPFAEEQELEDHYWFNIFLPYDIPYLPRSDSDSLYGAYEDEQEELAGKERLQARLARYDGKEQVRLSCREMLLNNWYLSGFVWQDDTFCYDFIREENCPRRRFQSLVNVLRSTSSADEHGRSSDRGEGIMEPNILKLWMELLMNSCTYEPSSVPKQVQHWGAIEHYSSRKKLEEIYGFIRHYVDIVVACRNGESRVPVTEQER